MSSPITPERYAIHIAGLNKQIETLKVDYDFLSAAHADCEDEINQLKEKVDYLERGMRWIIRASHYMGFTEIRMAIDEMLKGSWINK